MTLFRAREYLHTPVKGKESRNRDSAFERKFIASIVPPFTKSEREKFNDYPETGHLLFLFESYRPNFYFFEGVECLRRLALSSMLVFVADGSAAQIVFAIIVAALSARVYCALRPFVSETTWAGNNLLAESSQWQLVSTSRPYSELFGFPLSLSCFVFLSSRIQLFLYLGALLHRVDATGDTRSDQNIFSAMLIAMLIIGPICTVIAYYVTVGDHLQSSSRDAASRLSRLKSSLIGDPKDVDPPEESLFPAFAVLKSSRGDRWRVRGEVGQESLELTHKSGVPTLGPGGEVEVLMVMQVSSDTRSYSPPPLTVTLKRVVAMRNQFQRIILTRARAYTHTHTHMHM